MMDSAGTEGLQGILDDQAAGRRVGLVAVVDGQYDSPGFSAAYGSGTVMDLDTKKVLEYHIR